MVLGHCQFSIFSRMAHASQQYGSRRDAYRYAPPKKDSLTTTPALRNGMRKAGNHRTRQSCHGEN